VRPAEFAGLSDGLSDFPNSFLSVSVDRIAAGLLQACLYGLPAGTFHDIYRANLAA
jgi:hypothetical protein